MNTSAQKGVVHGRLESFLLLFLNFLLLFLVIKLNWKLSIKVLSFSYVVYAK